MTKLISLISLIAIFATGCSRPPDMDNIRQIHQATLIYATDNNDMIPNVTNVHEYARQLAIDGGLNDANIWFIEGKQFTNTTTVLGDSHLPIKDRSLYPAFAKATPDYTVLLGKMNVAEPGSVPIAWTRGLQRDGTWKNNAPYGTRV